MTDKFADLRAALAMGPTPGPWKAHDPSESGWVSITNAPYATPLCYAVPYSEPLDDPGHDYKRWVSRAHEKRQPMPPTSPPATPTPSGRCWRSGTSWRRTRPGIGGCGIGKFPSGWTCGTKIRIALTTPSTRRWPAERGKDERD